MVANGPDTTAVKSSTRTPLSGPDMKTSLIDFGVIAAGLVLVVNRWNDRRQQPRPAPAYSITSSARASNDAGTSRPSALAVLRLITSSYFVGCWTGISAATPPLSRRSA